MRVEGGDHPLAHFMDDFNEKSKSKALQDRSAVLQGGPPNPFATALRLRPEYFTKLVAYYEHLDSNPNKKLSEYEFMKVSDWDPSMRKDGRETYELFSDADSEHEMSLQEFVRLVAVVTKVPDGFDYTADDLKALPSSTVAGDQDRDALMRLFAVFDENTNGDVDKAEFQHAWMGPTLWKLREEGVLSSAWMASIPEFDFAKGEFAKRAGADNVLSLAEFAYLLRASVKHRDAREYTAREYTGPTLPAKGSSKSINTLTAFFITFAFGAVISSA